MNRWLAFSRLIRLPNVFTAIADIMVGLLAGRHEIPAWSWITLPTASAFLYWAGMAWNDYFDRDIDKIERPLRPIPSGAIKVNRVLGAANFFAVVGLVFAICSGFGGSDWTSMPLVHAIVLTALIFGYDRWLKATSFGPIVMGACRSLNILLGFSMVSVEAAPWPMRMTIALALGFYVAGITVIARDEVGTTRKERLRWGILLSTLGLILVAVLPSWSPSRFGSAVVYLTCIAAVFFIAFGRPLFQSPSPATTQCFVKTSLLAIIVFDTLGATAIAGPIGLGIVVLLIPAMILGRWVYST